MAQNKYQILTTTTYYNLFKQESCAIAKTTAQCALYVGALTNFGTP